MTGFVAGVCGLHSSSYKECAPSGGIPFFILPVCWTCIRLLAVLIDARHFASTGRAVSSARAVVGRKPPPLFFAAPPQPANSCAQNAQLVMRWTVLFNKRLCRLANAMDLSPVAVQNIALYLNHRHWQRQLMVSFKGTLSSRALWWKRPAPFCFTGS